MTGANDNDNKYGKSARPAIRRSNANSEDNKSESK